MARQRQMRLSDVYANGGPFLGPRTTFITAFPTIEELRVEVNEAGSRAWGLALANFSIAQIRGAHVGVSALEMLSEAWFLPAKLSARWN